MGIHNTIRSSATSSFATMRLACVILATAALLVSPVLGQTYSSVAEAASSTPDLSILLLAAQQAELAVIDPSEIGPGGSLLTEWHSCSPHIVTKSRTLSNNAVLHPAILLSFPLHDNKEVSGV